MYPHGVSRPSRRTRGKGTIGRPIRLSVMHSTAEEACVQKEPSVDACRVKYGAATKTQAKGTQRHRGSAPAARTKYPLDSSHSGRPYRPSGFHATLRTVRGKTSPPTVDRQVQPAAEPSAPSPPPAASTSGPSCGPFPLPTPPFASPRPPSSTPGGGAHKRTLASAPADASNPPSGDHATHHTAPVWPVRVADSASA